MKALQRVKHRVRAWKSRRSIDSLIAHESRPLNAVGHALREAAFNSLSPNELKWVSLIENRRSGLLASREIVEVVDYGAGDRESKRTEGEMKAGVRSPAFVSDLCRVSKSPFWSLFLFKLIRQLGARSCLELGTCVGISASYQAAALDLNGGGRLLTLEGAPEIAAIAKQTFSSVQAHNVSVVVGPFHDTYEKALEAGKPIDFLFNDGHHDHDALLTYFDQSLAFLAGEGVVVFDDIAWSAGMQAAWRTIQEHERVAASVDLGAMGVSVVSSGGGNERYSIPF